MAKTPLTNRLVVEGGRILGLLHNACEHCCLPESCGMELAKILAWRQASISCSLALASKIQLVQLTDHMNTRCETVGYYPIKEQSGVILDALLWDICQDVESRGVPVAGEVYVHVDHLTRRMLH